MHPSPVKRQVFKHFPCPEPGCNRTFSNARGRSSHLTTIHRRTPRNQNTNSTIPSRIQTGDGPQPPATPNRSLAVANPHNDIIPDSTTQTAFRAMHSPRCGAEHDLGLYGDDDFGFGAAPDDFRHDSFSLIASPRRSSTPAGSVDENSSQRSQEPAVSEEPARAKAAPRVEFHPNLTGEPCNADGSPVDPGAPPPPPSLPPVTNFHPFRSAGEFQMADFLFRKEQMSGANIDALMQIMGTLVQQEPPFADHKDLYNVIDAIEHGDAPWKSFYITYTGSVPETGPTPTWMTQEFEVWTRDPEVVLSNQLKNTDFAKEMDYCPKQVYTKASKREYKDFMSGNWCWRQSDIIYKNDPSTQGATFCPIITGSDKTTVSVGTGHTEYHPLYISNGLIHNNVRHAHREGVSLLAFMCIPKTDKEYEDDDDYRSFRRQLFHSSIHEIFCDMKVAMEKPVVKLCADGHYRRIIFGLGPHIADYPEQVILACIVYMWCPRCTVNQFDFTDLDAALPRSKRYRDFLLENMDPNTLWNKYGMISDAVPFTNGFPRADIHENMSMDILHQLVKGTFKDHLVEWTIKYLNETYSKAIAEKILSDIDRRIASTPHFTGLRRFPQGRGFQQWTGDDSKALMKVFLPAIVGHVPEGIVQAIASFMEFCYLVRRSVIDEDALHGIETALASFLEHRQVFLDLGVRENFNLPHQHSMVHDPSVIRDFAAPNGLCSSITESKHIKAVKEPWRRSNRFNAIGQMLLTNQRLDKLTAARADFTARGILDTDPFAGILPAANPPAANSPPAPAQPQEDDEAEGATDVPFYLGEVKLAKTRARKFPKDIASLAEYIQQPDLIRATRCFLYSCLLPDSDIDPLDLPEDQLPHINSQINVFNSAVATFHAPSDQSGLHGMIKERIRCSRNWRGSGYPRRDCMFASKDSDTAGFLGLYVVRVLLFFSFEHAGKIYPCTLVQWFSEMGEEPCSLTGMWRVEAEFTGGKRSIGVLHLETILRAAHLIPMFGDSFIPREVNLHNSLDIFSKFYVNKYADHHSHEIAF